MSKEYILGILSLCEISKALKEVKSVGCLRGIVKITTVDRDYANTTTRVNFFDEMNEKEREQLTRVLSSGTPVLILYPRKPIN